MTRKGPDMKRRIIMIVVVMGLFAVVAAGIWWYVRQNSSARLLVRADLAMQAGKLEKAESLADSYIDNNPDDWRGYRTKASICMRLGRYTEARELLADASARGASRISTALTLADTHTLPARQLLSSQGNLIQADVFKTAIEQFRLANEILIELDAKDPAKGLDAQRALGLNQTELARALAALADRLAQEARTAISAGAEAKGDAKRKASVETREQANAQFERAIETLLDLVQRDSSDDLAGQVLVELCLQHNDAESLAVARQVILGAEQPPPIAAMMLIVRELEARGGEAPDLSQPEWQAKIVEASAQLDELLADHADLTQLKLMRAKLALAVADNAKADELLKEILKLEPRQGQARFLEARLLLSQGNALAAEEKLFALKAEFPMWAEVRFTYGQAAMATGKEELALQEMRTVTQLSPGHARARQYLAESLLRQGHYQQAFADARACYDANPKDASAIQLFVRTALRTDQPDLARETLDKAAVDCSSDPTALMVVVEGYALLGDRARMLEVANMAARSEPVTVAQRSAVAQALLRTDRQAEAERILSDLFAENPQSASVNFALARLYSATGRTLQALERYQEAVALAKDNDSYRLALARALLDNGDLEECQSVLEGIKYATDRAALLRFQIELIKGEPVDMEEYLEQSPAVGGLPFALAYLRSGQPQRCVEICKTELQRTPGDLTLIELLGQAYLALRKPDECLQQWDRLITASPRTFSNYLRVVSFLGRSWDKLAVARHLTTIPGADETMTELAMGWLYDRTGEYDLAAAAFKRVANRAAAGEDTRNRARLLLAQTQAHAGDLDAALGQFEHVTSAWHNQAQFLKAQLLVTAQRPEQANAILQEITARAVQRRDTRLLRQTAMLHRRAGQMDKALAVCDELEQLLPEDPLSHILRGSLLDAAGEPRQAIQSYRKAIDCQPDNFSHYIMLSRALDNQQESSEALAVLEELEGLGQTARSVALYERGLMFAKWGLQSQALKSFEELGAVGHTVNTKIQLAVAMALAALGDKKLAQESLDQIPPYSKQYVEGQLLSARLAVDTEAKLDILARLQTEHPADSIVLSERMSALAEADRADEALPLLQSYVEKHLGDRPLPADLRPGALRAISHAQDRQVAAGLCTRLHEQTRQNTWRYLAVVLLIDDRPERAKELLPEIGQSDLYGAILGVCLSVQSKDADAAGAWADRVAAIRRQFIDSGRAGLVRPSHTMLVDLAVGSLEQAARPERLEGADTIDKETALELIAYIRASKDYLQAAQLLKAEATLDLGLRQLAGDWAAGLLRSRPTCQWAAAIALRASTDDPTLRLIADKLQPEDCLIAQVIRAELAMRQRQFDEAAELYGWLEQQVEAAGAFLFAHGTALENADRQQDALEVYQRAWQSTQNPLAANNAASLLAELSPAEPDKLAQAQQLAEAAITANPRFLGFRDTAGWIAYLQGRTEQARKEFRSAIKALPNSPEVHYHLGMAEAAGGDADLARWHLAAALEIGQKLQADGAAIMPTAAKSIRLAGEALAKMDTDVK